MSERKFYKSVAKPGTAAQLRETVSQVVRETTVQNKPTLVEPLDFEKFLQENKTILQNDPHRELLIYPHDDVAQTIIPRTHRSLSPFNIPIKDTNTCNLFTKQCLASYSNDWTTVNYKYHKYSGQFYELPNIKQLPATLKEDTFEVDLDPDEGYEINKAPEGITKEGYLMKGPEGNSEKILVTIGSKNFKRRYCYLRQEVDGTYMLELYKDEKKGEAKVTIVMDFCKDVVKNAKRSFCFELRMTEGRKSYILAAENEADYKDWFTKLNFVVQQNAVEETRAASLERAKSSLERGNKSSLERGKSSPCANNAQSLSYGTLKGLEHSMNPQLMRYARESDLSIAHARKENRRKLLQLYAPINSATIKQSSQEPSLEPYKEVFGHRVWVKFKQLSFKLQTHSEENHFQIEPYFTTLSLYDARNGAKLTENFHFDVNDQNARLMVPNGTQKKSAPIQLELPDKLLPDEWLQYPKQALLSVMNPHCDIFLVVRIDKVLQGSIYQASEPYVKVTKDSKNILKTFRTVTSCCQRLGSYRMPFAWAAKPLFRLYSNELDTTSEFPAIFRQEPSKMTDEELIKLLSEYRKPDKFSKLTVIPGSLKVNVEPIAEMPNNCLTTSLVPVNPFPIPPKREPTIEIAEFEQNNEQLVHPHTTFVDHFYVYPNALNFDTQKVFARARNIACSVEVRDSDEENAKGIQCIYGRPGHPALVSKAFCAVLHHCTTPNWYEEIKIRLPITIQSTHHLLFSFYHISCDINKKRDTIESSIGYAWIPLLQKGRLCIDTQTVPVASQLPAGYLSIQPFGLNKGYSGPEVLWIDCQKPIFTVSFKLISSVNTNDQHLFNFFSHVERLLDPKPVSVPSENETCKILKALHAIQLTTLIAYLPTIFNQLFILLVSTNNEEIGLNIVRVLINLGHMIYEANRKEILQTYVKYVFVTTESAKNTTTVHEEMCKFLPKIWHQQNTEFPGVNKFMHHSNFFFEIITKSMAQHLLRSGRIKMHRNERFPRDYLQKLENMSTILMESIIGDCNDSNHNQPNAAALNISFALFLNKCLSLMDRGFIFKIINKFMAHFDPGIPRSLNEIKFTFLKIICSHEHFIGFNLPISHNSIGPRGRSPDFAQEYCLSEDFAKHHFLVALLLQEVKATLNEISQIRRVALVTLRDLIAKHELDERYQNNGQMSRIVLIYVPWLSIVLENINRLIPDDKIEDLNTSNYISSPSSYLFRSSVSDTTCRNRYTLHFSDSPKHLRNSAFFDAIAGQTNIVNGHSSMSIESDASDNNSLASQETTIVREPKPDPGKHSRAISTTVHCTQQVPRYDKLQPAETKDILLVFLYIVKYLGDDQLKTYWKKATDSDVTAFFTVFEISLNLFKYKGKRNVNVSTPTNDMKPKSKAHTLPARINPSEMNNHETSGTLVIHTKERENLAAHDDETVKRQAVLEQYLANEVGLIILDCMGLYCQHFRGNLLQFDGNNAVMRKIFDLYLTFIEIGQGESLFKHVFASLRSFINNYSVILFQGNATLCGRLCYELLKCCNSRLTSVRQESAAMLYLLMRANYEFTGRKGITRVHLKAIISVSQIIGNVTGLNNSRFQESLSIVNSFASSDKVMKDSTFPTEVKDLTKRIRTVLMATLQMKEHHGDPEMLVDLQHSLANSYASTPELRHTWLENMSNNHVRDGNYSEAACCQLHIVALISEYLKLKKIQPWGAEAFEKISHNISRDENNLKLDVGVQDIQYTEQTLLQKLESCVSYIEKAERYEILPDLYKLITPIYEKKRNYQLLQDCYQHLASFCGKVVEVNKSGKRMLGRFYRVAFYGQAFFEEDNCIEYVYKEPKLTSLSEITERLCKQYGAKFGAESVRMIQDSIPINGNDLDQKLAHIQVTHVTPYFEKYELEERPSEFEQNHNVACFKFETPFTKDGKVRGNPEEQWKRRTILFTEYTFPYVTKRIKVKSKRCIELSPIEVAIDEMRNRVSELEDIVFSDHTDAIKLQLILQGSVYVQVNAGPLAYATAFLDSSLVTLYADDKVEELKDIFRDFSKICFLALQRNGEIISNNQREYQEVLKDNYKKLRSSLSAILGENLWPYDDSGRNSTGLIISGSSSNFSTA